MTRSLYSSAIMNNTSPMTSTTAGQEIQHLSCSSPPLSPATRLSLQSRELQEEFLKERQNKFRPRSDVSESSPISPSSPSSPLPSPFSPPSSPWSSSSSPSPSHNNRSARLSLSSPELLAELKQPRTRSLRHVPAHSGLTTVFSGRGRRGGGGGGGGPGQDTGSAPSTQPTNQKTSC